MSGDKATREDKTDNKDSDKADSCKSSAGPYPDFLPTLGACQANIRMVFPQEEPELLPDYQVSSWLLGDDEMSMKTSFADTKLILLGESVKKNPVIV